MKKSYYLLFLALLSFQCGVVSQRTMDNDLTEIAKWKINDGKLGKRTILREKLAPNTINDIPKIWTKINAILPAAYLKKYVKEFELITDGKEATLAGVKPIDESNKYWTLGVDPIDIPVDNWQEKRDFLHTLIHEFGHILTLNNTQVESSDLQFQKDKTRYLTNEGLAKNDSYINQFVQQFWYKDDLILEWDKIDRTRNQNKKLDRLYNFYLINRTKFYTDYAAESPEEDIAESWYYFVIKVRPNGQLIKDQKLLFFYNFPELIQLRNEIRSSLSFSLKNNRE